MMNAIVRRIGVAVILVLSVATGFFAYQGMQYDFKTLDATTYRWTDLEGHWVIINYFAPWCTPCLREMPELNAFNKNLPSNTLLFAINYDTQTPEQMLEMKKRFAIELPLIVSERKTKLPMTKPPYLPATFIISPSGEVKDTILGEISERMLIQKLSRLKTPVDAGASWP